MRDVFGRDALGKTAAALFQAALQPRTYENYGSNLRSFLQYYGEGLIDPLGATPVDIARYLAWLGHRGTIAADSLQPYLSAIEERKKENPLQRGQLEDIKSSMRCIVLFVRYKQVPTGPRPSSCRAGSPRRGSPQGAAKQPGRPRASARARGASGSGGDRHPRNGRRTAPGCARLVTPTGSPTPSRSRLHRLLRVLQPGRVWGLRMLRGPRRHEGPYHPAVEEREGKEGHGSWQAKLPANPELPGSTRRGSPGVLPLAPGIHGPAFPSLVHVP